MARLPLGARVRGSLLIGCILFVSMGPIASADPDASKKDSAESCRVKLSWKTETETDAFGYLVYRGTTSDNLVCINADRPLHAAGTTTTPARYRYYDLKVECGVKYFYRVSAVDLDGTEEWIIGDQAPVETAAKPLTGEEKSEIKDYGDSFRREESVEQAPTPRLSPR